jgi:hypothetical protein
MFHFVKRTTLNDLLTTGIPRCLTYDLAPSPSPVSNMSSQSVCELPVELTDGRGGKRGEAKSYDVRESLVLCIQYSLTTGE